MTAPALINEIVEAADHIELSRLIGKYAHLDLLCLDEVGYIQLDTRGAELLFQIITAREERASIACSSNAPFSEWGQTFTDARLAAARQTRAKSTCYSQGTSGVRRWPVADRHYAYASAAQGCRLAKTDTADERPGRFGHAFVRRTAPCHAPPTPGRTGKPRDGLSARHRGGQKATASLWRYAMTGVPPGPCAGTFTE